MIGKPGTGGIHAIKPGCLPKSTEQKWIHACDTQERVDACLSCALPKCRAESPACKLVKMRNRTEGRSPDLHPLDGRIRDMLLAGWRDGPLCMELGISERELTRAKERIAARDKPANPYKKGSVIWSIMEGDWEDLTAAEIAEVLSTTMNSVWSCIGKIKRETGYVVPHAREKTGGKEM